MNTRAHSPCSLDLWSRILAVLGNNVNQQCFDTWFRPIVFAGHDDTGLCLIVPNESFRRCFLENYGDILHDAASKAAGAAITVQVVAAEAFPESTTAAIDRSSSDAPAPLTVIRASALQTASSRRPWLVESLWCAEAVGVIGGMPKCGKTTLALEMAVSVASATPCLGTFPVHSPGSAMLYAAEDSAASLRTRLEILARSHNLDIERLDVRVIIADSLRLDRPDDQQRLEVTLSVHRPALLVLDPLIRLHHLDENQSAPMAALLEYLRNLQRKTGAAVALVHHTRKNVSPAAGAGYTLRGSSDVYAWLDSLLYLRKHQNQLTLSAEHRTAPPFGPIALELAQSENAGTHLRIASPLTAAPTQDTLADRILDILAASNKPLTADNLRSRLQVRNQRLVEALRQLFSQGKVQRLPQGYTLGNKGE
jgi:hypothetical protein